MVEPKNAYEAVEYIMENGGKPMTAFTYAASLFGINEASRAMRAYRVECLKREAEAKRRAKAPQPIHIKSITVNEDERVVCVVFDDGKRIVRCDPHDQFDAEVGVSIAIARHVLGSRNKVMRELDKARWVAPKPCQEPKPEPKPRRKSFREFAKSHGFRTLSLLAKASGVSRQTLYAIDAGKPCKAKTLIKLVCAMNLDEKAEGELKAIVPHSPDYRTFRQPLSLPTKIIHQKC